MADGALMRVRFAQNVYLPMVAIRALKDDPTVEILGVVRPARDAALVVAPDGEGRRAEEWDGKPATTPCSDCKRGDCGECSAFEDDERKVGVGEGPAVGKAPPEGGTTNGSVGDAVVAKPWVCPFTGRRAMASDLCLGCAYGNKGTGCSYEL